MASAANDWVVLRPGGVPNACRAVEFSGFDDDHLLTRGEALRARWPSGVRYLLDGELPRGQGPSAKPCKPAEVVVPDVVRARNAHVIVSERLAQHVAATVVVGIELLPVVLTPAKGKKWPAAAALERPFFIVNPVGLVACIDEARSGAKRDRHAPEQIERFRRLVLDPARIERARTIFRAAHLRGVIFVARDFAESVVAAGFTGAAWIEVSELES